MKYSQIHVEQLYTNLKFYENKGDFILEESLLT